MHEHRMESCQQHSSMPDHGLLISESSKRNSEDSLEGERPSKSRRVQFSDVSSLRMIEASNRSECDFEANQNDQCDILDVSKELPPCSSTNDSAFDIQIVTKQRDGASAATITTQRLIRLLIKQKSISTKQVIELLGGAPVVNDTEKPQDSDWKLCAAPDPQPEQNEVEPVLARPDPSLCLQVIERLRALSERIEKHGKAAMLPCTTNLGPNFLPAIRFLASSVAVSIPRAALVKMAQG
uniref:Uncharacterized protein n=1 Tax=Cryptomonas curvata TaxID=233186 RepID=A0A7S0QGU0_9CRYP|mmetsp:Transcript_35238/g.73805  ORF Transcript_35238/g.73805 Transcript_35238/m.73805 type:complete len:239 (+) Transcript_35238:78-794(+)